MKKVLTILILLGLLVLPALTFAQDIYDVLDNILDAIWTITVVLVAIFGTYAGILYLTSRGDPEKMERAKKAFIYVVIGAVVAIIAGFVVSWARDIMGV